MRSIDKVIEAVKEEAGDYTGGSWIEDCVPSELYNSLAEFKCIEITSDGESRWSISKTAIWKVKDDVETAYLAASWEAPATEMQEGQDTMLELYEVKPIEVMVTRYEAV